MNPETKNQNEEQMHQEELGAVNSALEKVKKLPKEVSGKESGKDVSVTPENDSPQDQQNSHKEILDRANEEIDDIKYSLSTSQGRSLRKYESGEFEEDELDEKTKEAGKRIWAIQEAAKENIRQNSGRSPEITKDVEKKETEAGALSRLMELNTELQASAKKKSTLVENEEARGLLEKCEPLFEELTQSELEEVSKKDAYAYFETHKDQKVYKGKGAKKELGERMLKLYTETKAGLKEKKDKSEQEKKDIKLYNYIEETWGNLSDEEKTSYEKMNEKHPKNAKFNFVVELAKKRFKNIELNCEKNNIGTTIAEKRLGIGGEVFSKEDDWKDLEKQDKKFKDSYIYDEGGNRKIIGVEADKLQKENIKSFGEKKKKQASFKQREYSEEEKEQKRKDEEYRNASHVKALRIEVRDAKEWISEELWQPVKKAGIFAYSSARHPVRSAKGVWSFVGHPIKFWKKEKEEPEDKPEKSAMDMDALSGHSKKSLPVAEFAPEPVEPQKPTGDVVPKGTFGPEPVAPKVEVIENKDKIKFEPMVEDKLRLYGYDFEHATRKELPNFSGKKRVFIHIPHLIKKGEMKMILEEEFESWQREYLTTGERKPEPLAPEPVVPAKHEGLIDINNPDATDFELDSPTGAPEAKPELNLPVTPKPEAAKPVDSGDQEQELKRKIEELEAKIKEAQSGPMPDWDQRKIGELAEERDILEARLPKPKKETKGGQENKGGDDKLKLLEELVKTQAIKKASNVLGVLESSVEGEIERAWVKLSRQHHPDRNPGDNEAKKKYEHVQSAYGLLTEKDESKKLKRAKDFLLEIAKK